MISDKPLGGQEDTPSKPDEHEEQARTSGQGVVGRQPLSRTGPERTPDLDRQVLLLRDSGKTYAAVAHTLGIERAVEAQAAFVRAIKSSPEVERREFVHREFDRLDVLEKSIRDDGAPDPEKMHRRLAALKKLRLALS